MRTKRGDLRTEKTYAALIAAFEDLLTETSYEKITVTALCRRAQTRTATFYSHFEDKDDFWRFLVAEKRHSFAAPPLPASAAPVDYYLAITKQVLAFVQANPALIRHLTASTLASQLMTTDSAAGLTDLKHHLMADLKKREVDLELQLFLGAASQVIHWWIGHQDQVSQTAVLGAVRDLVLGLMNQAQQK